MTLSLALNNLIAPPQSLFLALSYRKSRQRRQLQGEDGKSVPQFTVLYHYPVMLTRASHLTSLGSSKPRCVTFLKGDS